MSTLSRPLVPSQDRSPPRGREKNDNHLRSENDEIQGAGLGARHLSRSLGEVPFTTLELAGSGPHEPQLANWSHAWSMGPVTFSEECPISTRFKLYQSSRVLLNPSIREGLRNIRYRSESFGTPAVGWDVAGMRDSVINGSTAFWHISRQGSNVQEHRDVADER